MRLVAGSIAALLAVLTAWAPPAPAADGPVVYQGRLEGATNPAQVVAATVFEEIPEYKEIGRRGLGKDDPEYWVLLHKANEKFYRAVKKVADEDKYDVVVEKGTAEFEGEVPDITQEVIEALEK